MKRCVECLLPTSYPRLSFDDRGVCAFCNEAKRIDRPSGSRAQELSEILAYAKSLNSPYQVIVPFSGGKDSAYVLYYLKTVVGLRPIAVNFNNGFRSKYADINLKEIPKRLSVDLIKLNLDWSLMKKLYQAFLKTAGEFCSVCNAMGYITILSFVFRETKRLGVAPLVVGGWSRTYEEMPNVYSFDVPYFWNVIEKSGLCQEVLSSPLVEKEAVDFLRASTDPRQMTHLKNVIQLPDYLDWDVSKITRTLIDEVGWRIPQPGLETHFDCIAHPLSKYLEFKKYGFDQTTITLSAQIRHGKVTREQALRTLEKHVSFDEQKVAEILRLLEISQSEIAWNGLWHPQSSSNER